MDCNNASQTDLSQVGIFASRVGILKDEESRGNSRCGGAYLGNRYFGQDVDMNLWEKGKA
jgi:hypothetical protein